MTRTAARAQLEDRAIARGSAPPAGGKPPSRVLAHLKPVGLALALLAVLMAIPNGLAGSLGKSPPFALTLAGSFVLHVATRPAKRELALTILAGVLLRLVYGVSLGVDVYFCSALISLAGCLGVASLAALAVTAIRRHRFSPFGIAAFFPLFSIVVGFVLPLINRWSPVVFDAHLLSVDGTLGFQPSFALGSLIHGRPLLWDLTATLYYALPLAVAVLFAIKLSAGWGETSRLLWLFALLGLVGYCLYIVCPATGPAYAFRDLFPLKPPRFGEVPLTPLRVPLAPRNAMPSLHFSTALLVFWNAWELRRIWRVLAALFLVGTTFAILALGEHYVADIVVAIPFSLMFQAAFTKPSRCNRAPRTRAILGGAACTALWLVLLRFHVEPLLAWPAATCAAAVLTTGFSWAALRALRSSSRVLAYAA